MCGDLREEERQEKERGRERKRVCVWGGDYQGNGEDLFFFILPLSIIFLEMSMLLFVMFP